MVFNDRDEILLIRRGKPPHYGRWMIPGGSLEWGESLEAAATREVREETGIEIEIEAFAAFVEAIAPDGAEYHFLIMDYVAHATGGSLQAGSDALEAAWVSASSLSELSLTQELLSVIEKARRITGRPV